MDDVKILEETVEPSRKSKLITYLIEGAILVAALLLGLMIRWGLYETTIVTSRSMASTLKVNDRLLIDHRASLHGTWQRGDIITFQPPDSWGGQEETFIKRVIGLPGETVEIRSGQVFINEQVLTEIYLKETPDSDSNAPLTLGRGQYYVLGDNRNNSDDSRNNGPITDAQIRGRAVYRLGPFSRVGTLPAVSY